MQRIAFSKTAMSRFALAEIVLACLFCMVHSTGVWAWGYEGHRVVGSIADQLLRPNAKAQVQHILNPDDSRNLNLRLSGPWPDCVRSVVRHPNGTFEYVVNPEHFDFEVPCRPFKSEAERARMVDYVSRNFSNCLYQPDGPDKPQADATTLFTSRTSRSSATISIAAFRTPTNMTSSP